MNSGFWVFNLHPEIWSGAIPLSRLLNIQAAAWQSFVSLLNGPWLLLERFSSVKFSRVKDKELNWVHFIRWEDKLGTNKHTNITNALISFEVQINSQKKLKDKSRLTGEKSSLDFHFMENWEDWIGNLAHVSWSKALWLKIYFIICIACSFPSIIGSNVL